MSYIHSPHWNCTLLAFPWALLSNLSETRMSHLRFIPIHWTTLAKCLQPPVACRKWWNFDHPNSKQYCSRMASNRVHKKFTNYLVLQNLEFCCEFCYFGACWQHKSSWLCFWIVCWYWMTAAMQYHEIPKDKFMGFENVDGVSMMWLYRAYQQGGHIWCLTASTLINRLKLFPCCELRHGISGDIQWKLAWKMMDFVLQRSKICEHSSG